jgi:hypothetical protein
VSLPRDRLPHAVAATEEAGTTLTEIGSASAGKGRVRLVDAGGERRLPAGFDHLRP